MRRIPLERKLKDTYGNKCVCCALCGDAIFLTDQRRWQANVPPDYEANPNPIIGIAFMNEEGEAIEGYDLCDNCIGKLYSKLIY